VFPLSQRRVILRRIARERVGLRRPGFIRRREIIAKEHIAGSGIEIGGLNAPLKVSSSASAMSIGRPCRSCESSIPNWRANESSRPTSSMTRGFLYLAVPDKRFTFDHDRPITSLEHLIENDENSPEVDRRAHYEEWVRLVDVLRKLPASTNVEEAV
jgi:hypothetical protein